MAQFTLTLKTDVNRPNNFHLDKGTQLNITIPMAGITPGNLFGNNRCQEALYNQFKLHGINLPPTDRGFYTRGIWDIKML